MAKAATAATVPTPLHTHIGQNSPAPPTINHIPHPIRTGACAYIQLVVLSTDSLLDFLQQLFAVLCEKDDTVQIKRGYVTVYSSHLGGATCCLCEICIEPGR